MYKNRNTGTGNEMRGTWGMEECYILRNIPKHSKDGRQAFRGMSSNIPGNGPQSFREISLKSNSNVVNGGYVLQRKLKETIILNIYDFK